MDTKTQFRSLAFIAIGLTMGMLGCRTVDYEYVVTQIIRNSTTSPVTLTVYYSPAPPRVISIPPGGEHTDMFSFNGDGVFYPVDSRFSTDSAGLDFTNTRSRVTYVNTKRQVELCASKNMYCIANYEEVSLNARHKQYTYTIDGADLAQAK